MARPGEGAMYQEPEMIFRTAQRQTMTSYAPPMHRRVDSDVGASLGSWGDVGQISGFTLLEWLISPVAGIVVLIVSYGLYIMGSVSSLSCCVKNPWGGKARTKKR